MGSFSVGIVGTLIVDSLADESDGDYSAGDFTLREAINLANSATGDTINFAPGLFATPQTITLTLGEIPVLSSVIVNGPGASKLTVSGNSASRIFNINDNQATAVAVTLNALTLANGKSTANGGGAISLGNESLTLNNCTVTNNASTSGTGGAINFITATGTTIVINGCSITNNTCSSNGGFLGTNGGINTFTITNSTFSGNKTTAGAGAVFDTGGGGGTFDAKFSTFSGNTSSGNGGVSSSGYATMNYESCTLSGQYRHQRRRHQRLQQPHQSHQLHDHRQYCLRQRRSNLHQCWRRHNEQVTVLNSTITGNTANGNGGGIRINSTSIAANVFITVRNSIISGNTNATAPDISRAATRAQQHCRRQLQRHRLECGLHAQRRSGGNLASAPISNSGPSPTTAARRRPSPSASAAPRSMPAN